MANILKVSQPLGGYENSVRNNPINTNDPNVTNQVNLGKVTRTDDKDEYGQKQFSFANESNFGSFLNSIQNLPSLTQIFSKFMFMELGQVVSSGMNEDFAEEIAKFMDMLNLSESGITSFLKNQTVASSRFQGVLFQAMHQIMDGTISVELKTEILDFMKKYNDMASGEHLLTNIKTNLAKITQFMFPDERVKLEEMAAQLDQGAKNGETQQNAALLKNKIIPFLSDYIGKTHDLGKIRDIITLLTLNTARYENGDQKKILQSFSKVLNFTEFRAKLGGVDLDNLSALLQRVEEENKNVTAPWAKQFLTLMEKGVNGDNGYETKLVFQNMMNSMLMNESVYMPLVHLMLPLNYEGALMFSELWIDPDDQSSKKGKAEEEGRRIKGLIKFDIQDVGFFDLIFQYGDNGLDLRLFYPDKLVSEEKEILNRLGAIVTGNGLSVKNLQVEQCVVPKTITEVFPQVYERKDSVNVRV